MPSNVKLTTAEYRAWRVNKAQWVSPEGYVLRAVTPEEERALFPAVERTKQLGKTQTYTLGVVYKMEDPDTGRETETKTPMDTVVRITATGRERSNIIADIFVNSCRYIKGREIIEKRMLATHGECNLYGPNGKRLRVIRNPNVRRPTYSESQRVAPHPDNCHCRGWKDKRDQDRHHAACNWNEKAPPHERALPFHHVVEHTIVDSPEPIESLAFDPQSVRSRPAPADRSRQLRPSAPPAPPGTPRQPGQRPAFVEPVVFANVPEPAERATHSKVEAVEMPQIFAPSECPEDCRGVKNPETAWRWPAGRKVEKGQHHPLCPHDGSYRQKMRGEEVWMLYDIARQVEVREATVDEVTRSEIELGRSGTRSVTVGGRIYAIVQPGQSDRPPPRHQARRQALLEAAHLPNIPERPLASSESREIAELRARLAELEGRTSGQLRVNAPPVAEQFPLAAMARTAPVMHPADYLRDGMGLVGHQQATDDIPLGPVELAEPEPFVDPIAREHGSRRPPDYHPGVTRPRGFVPPGPPGPVAPVAVASRVIDTEATELAQPEQEEQEEAGPDDPGPDEEGIPDTAALGVGPAASYAEQPAAL